MPSLDERREVAARLRGLYPDDVLPPFAQVRKDIREAIGCGWGQEHRSEKMHKRLADLIEPEPERTCEIEFDFPQEVGFKQIDCHCSECWHGMSVHDHYCAACGAKVVS